MGIESGSRNTDLHHFLRMRLFKLLVTLGVALMALSAVDGGVTNFLKQINDIKKKDFKFIGKLGDKLAKKLGGGEPEENCQVVWEEHKQPHCSTDYKQVCEDGYEEKCTTEYVRECVTDNQRKCSTDYVEQCTPTTETKCATEYTNQCSTIYEQSCHTVQDQQCWDEPVQECSTTYEEQCWTEDKRECSSVPECSTIYDKQCSTSYRTECNEGNKKKKLFKRSATAATAVGLHSAGAGLAGTFGGPP